MLFASGAIDGRKPGSLNTPAHLKVAEQIAEVEQPGLNGLAAAESKQLAGEAAGSAGGVQDFLEPRDHMIGGGVARAFERELAIAGDDGQQVIEIVRNAARKTPESLHFARLRELILKDGALRDVDADAAHQDHLVAFDDRELVDEPGVNAVGMRHRFHELDGTPAYDDRVIVFAVAFGIFGAPDLFVGLADDVFRTQLELRP